MAFNSGTPSSSTFLRWTALIVVEASMGFIAVYSTLSTSATIAEVLAEYGNTLVPVGFAKAICVAILIAFLLFFFAALWPRRHRKRVYDRLVVPLALTSVLAASWVVAFRHQEIGLSVALIAACVVLGGVMFVRVASVSPGKHSRWLRVPFSLYFGAMTIALLVAVTQWLNASGLLTGPVVATHDVASAFLAIAAASGGVVALRYSDFVYPAVITSGLGSMFIAQRADDPDVATIALIACVGMFVVAGLAAVALATQPWRDPTKKASSRSARLARMAKVEGWYLFDANSSIMRL
jgi:hypothetical protein